MSVELIINSSPKGVVIAILQDGKLLELQKEKSDNNFSVGDIYLRKVKKIMPGSKATSKLEEFRFPPTTPLVYFSKDLNFGPKSR